MAEGAVDQPEAERPIFDPTPIKAVVFDAYGTLFDWDFRTALTDFLSARGIAVDYEVAAKTFSSEAFSAVSVWAPGHRGEDGKLDRKAMLDGPLPEFETTWEMWRRQWAYTFEKHEIADIDPIEGANHLRDVLAVAPAYLDAAETIERLAQAGYLVGLMSNADEDFLQGAVVTNRLRFSVIQSSESMRAYKPHRATFAGLCARLACEPHEVLYVGDSAPTDVLGAMHAGMRAAWIHRPSGQVTQEAQEPKDTEAKEEPREELPKPDIEVATLLEIATALGA